MRRGRGIRGDRVSRRYFLVHRHTLQRPVPTNDRPSQTGYYSKVKTPWVIAASEDIAQAAEIPKSRFRYARYSLSLWHTPSTLWLKAGIGRKAQLALRLAYAPDRTLCVDRAGKGVYNVSSSFARFRAQITVADVVRARVAFSPREAVSLTNWPRDLVFLSESGTVHTHQRGLRSGIVYASAPPLGTLTYFQNYTSLSEYFDVTQTSPADRIGGSWPEIGFALPANEQKPVPGGREFCVSDVFFCLSADAPESDGTLARSYLDQLATIYCAMERPVSEYHDWPHLAKQSLRHLSFSQECTLDKRRKTFLAPYVGDRSKPPESMVQFTVLLPLLEYSAWSVAPVLLADRMLDAIPAFFDSKVGALLRWPEGESAPGPPDVMGSTRYMDSWYLYHTLFNLGRLVKRTKNPNLRDLLKQSLAYGQRVARRFEYRWPVFFDLDTLEIFRAEAREGAGGENDVCGLYANVMLQAHDIFGETCFLEEAIEAAKRLRGLGFRIAYQMNATGFGAEAMLRLYLATGDKEYLDLSYLCLANVFDNMWLWQCRYGKAKAYRTFFGMFPLPDAPYLAAYEELEIAAKFREYLRLANDLVAPSVRLLLAEYCRFVLDRAWYYFPSNLPPEILAEHPQSGTIRRELAVPLEDLHDGWSECGQVGQEVYGAGIAPGLTVRHYHYIEAARCWLFCDYPSFDLKTTVRAGAVTVRFFIAGDARGQCSVRIVPLDAGKNSPRCSARIDRRRLQSTRTPEGDVLFALWGNVSVTLSIHRS